MTKNISLIGSLVLNMLLVLSLINIYLRDTYFQSWVNTSLGETGYGSLLILTLGIGGGSSLGYIFLKRKQPGSQGLSAKMPRSKLGLPLGTTHVSGASQTGKNMPSGTAPGQIPKHIVYAVPPAVSTKTSSPPSKQSPSLQSWSAGSKPVSPPQQGPTLSQIPRRDTPNMPPPQLASQPRQEPSLPSAVPRQPPAWRPETQPIDRKQDPTRVPLKPEVDFQTRSQQTAPPVQSTARPLQSFGEKTSPGGVIPPTPTKWQQPNQLGFPPSPQASGQQQRQDFDPAQKWAPVRPYGQQPPSPVPSPQQRQPPPGPPSQGSPIRPPPPGPFTARPLPPGAPRPPPTYQQIPGQAPFRAGTLGPVGVPRQPTPNPPRPIGPTQWTPPPSPNPSQSGDRPPLPRPQPSNQQQARPQTAMPTEPADNSGTDRSSPEHASGGGSDMDWDTALDTILKTLRRDRIRDEQ